MEEALQRKSSFTSTFWGAMRWCRKVTRVCFRIFSEVFLQSQSILEAENNSEKSWRNFQSITSPSGWSCFMRRNCISSSFYVLVSYNARCTYSFAFHLLFSNAERTWRYNKAIVIYYDVNNHVDLVFIHGCCHKRWLTQISHLEKIKGYVTYSFFQI